MPPRLSRLAIPIAALMVVLVAACGGSPAECRAAPLTEDAVRDLESVSAELDFTPSMPCAFQANAKVIAVYLDRLPGEPPGPRVSFDVTWGDARLYLLSQTRVEVGSTAIPQSSHHLHIVLDGDPDLEATGFAGPAGTGEDIVYLRWRRAGVTTEVLAIITPAFTEADVIGTARALMAGS